MDLKKTVLIFPCGTEIGLELHRALKYDQHLDLIGASSHALSNHGPYVFSNYIGGLPFVDEIAFIDRLNEVIEEHSVDFIFPAHDSVVLKLAESRGELLCAPVGSCTATCKVCRSKSATYELFSGKLRTPRIYSPSDHPLPFPLFVKPDAGQGSQGTALIQSWGELQLCLHKDPSLLLLEYLPGDEYTVDCFTDRHGQLRFAGARSRSRVRNGISVDTSPVQGQEFQDIARAINSTLSFQGLWFFQVKRAVGGELALLEIAPRLAGGMALYRNLGVNFPLLSIYDALGYDVNLSLNAYDICMDRALENRFKIDLQYSDVYVDLDDTFILNGTVNTVLIAFLFQCRARGIEAHLLSRCSGDIQYGILGKYALSQFFSTITRISNGMPKSRYIRGASAILIDDSFQERQEVHEALGIPTFAPDAVESLMDWRM